MFEELPDAVVKEERLTEGGVVTNVWKRVNLFSSGHRNAALEWLNPWPLFTAGEIVEGRSRNMYR